MKGSFIKYLEAQIFLISVVLATIIIMVGMTFLNDVVKYIRLAELKAYLRTINREDSNIDYLGMVSKYKLHKELYENKITVQQLDKIELRTSYLLSSYERKGDQAISKYNFVMQPVLGIINFLRFFLHKPPLQSVLSEAGNDEIAVAYYYEKNKEYENALTVYDQILQLNKVDEKKKPVIYLHQAFCYSIIGSYPKAEGILLNIIKDYDNEQIAIAAAILLQHIRDFQSEIQKVKASSANSLEKSEKLFKLIAFNDALNVLSEVKTEDKAQEEKIKYLQARCYEETGSKEKSVEIYQNIITQNIESGDYQAEYSKLANQRIYVMSTMDNENLQKLEKLAEVNNTLIKDEKLDELKETSTKFESFQEENKTVEAKIKAFEAEQTAKNSTPVPEASPTQTSATAVAATTGTLNPEATSNIQQTAAPETTNAAGNETEQNKELAKMLDTFINQSIDRVSKKIVEVEKNPQEVKPLPTVTEAPRPSATPVPTLKPTAKPTAKPIKTNPVTVPPTGKPDVTTKNEPSIKTIRDKDGKVNKIEYYDKNGALENYYIYEYDKNGNPIRVLNYDANGNLIEN